MSITTSSSSQGPLDPKLNENISVANSYEYSISNDSSSAVSVDILIVVEIEGKNLSNKISRKNVSVPAGKSIADNGVLSLTLAPDTTGLYKVKSTTRVDDDGTLGGPKEAISTNWSFQVSS